MKSYRRYLLVVGALCAGLNFSVVAAELPDLGDVSDTSMSLSDEARLGRSLIQWMRKTENVLVNDNEVSGYLDSIGGELASATRSEAPSLTFFGVNNSTVNAFAMPGGYIGVHTGLLLTTQSEGELASVLAHEIAHVRQRHLARQKAAQAPNNLLMLAAVAAAALVAGSGNGQASFGALSAGLGLSLSNQLAFSRDFEREADRTGMYYLNEAGFDVRDMPRFFERMQQNQRFDNNAYAFLHTHPVTSERISEGQNRASSYPVRMRADSLSYLLVREKLRVASMSPPDAVAYYLQARDNKLFLSEGAMWYGMGRAYLAAHRAEEAAAALKQAKRILPQHPMLYTLAADIARERGEFDEALRHYQQGLVVFPDNWALAYGNIALLMQMGKRADAYVQLRAAQAQRPTDTQLYRLEARYYADNDPLRYHAALGNAYYYELEYEAALEQYHLAAAVQDENKKDFFVRSSIEARTRELERELKEDKKLKAKLPPGPDGKNRLLNGNLDERWAG